VYVSRLVGSPLECNAKEDRWRRARGWGAVHWRSHRQAASWKKREEYCSRTWPRCFSTGFSAEFSTICCCPPLQRSICSARLSRGVGVHFRLGPPKLANSACPYCSCACASHRAPKGALARLAFCIHPSLHNGGLWWWQCRQCARLLPPARIAPSFCSWGRQH